LSLSGCYAGVPVTNIIAHQYVNDIPLRQLRGATKTNVCLGRCRRGSQKTGRVLIPTRATIEEKQVEEGVRIFIE